MQYYTVTVTHATRNAHEFVPHVTVFSDEERASSFKSDLEAIYAVTGTSEDLIVTLSPGVNMC